MYRRSQTLASFPLILLCTFLSRSCLWGHFVLGNPAAFTQTGNPSCMVPKYEAHHCQNNGANPFVHFHHVAYTTTCSIVLVPAGMDFSWGAFDATATTPNKFFDYPLSIATGLLWYPSCPEAVVMSKLASLFIALNALTVI